MQAIRLKKLLNTNRPVADYGDYIGIGSSYIHNLISIDKKTRDIHYAIYYRGGKFAIQDEEILGLWNILEAIIHTPLFDEILEKNDEFDNPLPVYTVKNGELFETQCAEYGYPNTTREGEIMHNNEGLWSDDPIKVLDYALRSEESHMGFCEEKIIRISEELNKAKQDKIDTISKIYRIRKKIDELRGEG